MLPRFFAYGISLGLAEEFVCSLRLVLAFPVLWQGLETLCGTSGLLDHVLGLQGRFLVEFG